MFSFIFLTFSCYFSFSQYPFPHQLGRYLVAVDRNKSPPYHSVIIYPSDGSPLTPFINISILSPQFSPTVCIFFFSPASSLSLESYSWKSYIHWTRQIDVRACVFYSTAGISICSDSHINKNTAKPSFVIAFFNHPETYTLIRFIWHFTTTLTFISITSK